MPEPEADNPTPLRSEARIGWGHRLRRVFVDGTGNPEIPKAQSQRGLCSGNSGLRRQQSDESSRSRDQDIDGEVASPR